MKHGLFKFFIIVFCSFFMVLGGLALIAGGLGGNLFYVVWGAMFFFIPFIILRASLKQIAELKQQLAKFEKMTYDWYKLEYPEKVKGNKVVCYYCGNDRIQVRALMNRTFHREHFCTQCGKTLYYSPEQS
jgi:hypothetical protein